MLSLRILMAITLKFIENKFKEGGMDDEFKG